MPFPVDKANQSNQSTSLVYAMVDRRLGEDERRNVPL
jgi:hypothetical protein